MSRSFFLFSYYWALRPLMCFANFTDGPLIRLSHQPLLAILLAGIPGNQIQYKI